MAKATSTPVVHDPRVPQSAHEFRAIAVRAHRDPRTVTAAYRGNATPLATSGIAEAAISLGYAPPPSAR